MTQSHKTPHEKSARAGRSRFAGPGRRAGRGSSEITRSVAIEELPTPGYARRTILLSFLMICGFVSWSAVVPLKELAHAQGEVIPIGNVKPIQHLEGGIVSAIHVAEGAVVMKGVPIVTLDGSQFESELSQMRARQVAKKVRSKRLQAFITGADFVAKNVPERFRGLVDDQISVLEIQRKSRDTQTSMIDQEIDAYQKTIEGLKRQLSSKRNEHRVLSDDFETRRALLKRRLTRRSEVASIERDVAKVSGEIAEIETRIASTAADRSQAMVRKVELTENLRHEALKELGQVEAEIVEIEQQMAHLENRVARLTVTAPVDGRVKDLSVLTAGEVVAPGAKIAEIVPTTNEVLAEVEVSPSDVGHVTPGAEVLARIATYDSARFGGIAGKVEYVSPANFERQDGTVYFKARLRLDENHVGAEHLGMVVSPGMTLTADIITNEKTLLQYLLRPLHVAMQTSFDER